MKSKKVLSLLLAVMILLSVLPFAGVTAFAAKSGDYKYQLLKDGTAEITEYTGTATNLTIPSSLDGYTVTSIGAEAFWDCSSLTNVKIPNTVTNLGDFAFANCPNLKSATIPKSVKTIGDLIFEYCSSLTDINVDSGNKNYSSQDGVLFDKAKTKLIQYPFGNERTSYSIPNSVKSIGDWAFRNCSNLTTVSIPNSVKSIGVLAFNCSGLTSLKLPDSVTSISGAAFAGCEKLKTVYLPNSITYISSGMFQVCTSLTSVTIPNGVKSINDGAFAKCFSLKSVTIPSSVTEIDVEAFDECNALKDVYYTGSSAQWNKITIDAFNTALKKATMHYNYVIQVANPKLSSVANAETGVKISWGKVSGAEKYRVFYKANGESTWHKAGDTASTSYTWTKAKSGTKYSFTVRCITSDGKAYASGYDKTGKSIKYIAAPKLSSVSNTATGVKISWGKVGGAEKYRVFYKANGESTWHKAGDTTSTSFTWTKAKSGTKYSFTVRCITKDGKSYPSSYDGKGKSITFLSAPKISSLSKTSSGVQINWGKVTGAVNYKVFRKTAGGSWKAIGTTTSTSFVDKTAKKGTKYTYTVRCISKDGKTYTSSYDNTGKTITY